ARIIASKLFIMSSCPLAMVVAELLDGQRHDGHVDALLRHPTPNPSHPPQVGPAARRVDAAKGLVRPPPRRRGPRGRRAVSSDPRALGPREPGPDCRISNSQGTVRM